MGLCGDSLDEILVLLVSDDRDDGFSSVSHLGACWNFHDWNFEGLVWFLFGRLDKCDTDVVLRLSVVKDKCPAVLFVIGSLYKT